ncbi:MAG: hypothetical protein KDC45_09415 [Bacteroidetes bacterium]|nr:hypothetical protein [Bacteroidota bacterium]
MDPRVLADYPWVVNSDIPWKHLSKELPEVKVAFLTTAGLYTYKLTKHFNLADPNGDTSFREIKKGITQGEIRVSHKDVNLNRCVGLDFNCIFPLDVLADLEKEKKISSSSEIHFSVMGEIRDPKNLLHETVPKILKQLQKFLVDVVVISAVGPLGHQNAGLIARALEEEDLTTIVIGGLRSVFKNVKPPRSILVRFPFGQSFGAPFDRQTQREILQDCLVHLKSIREPGEIAELPFRWEESYKRALSIKPDLMTMTAPEADSTTETKKRISSEDFK